jgi:hypothetical protein
MSTEAEMLELLRQRYTRMRPGTAADRYVRAAHVRYPTRYGQAAAVADYIVLDTYGIGTVLGFEVKCSRADWLAELRKPQKHAHWMGYCHEWYLVASERDIVRDDLPPLWGLMVPDKTGKLRIVQRAGDYMAQRLDTAVMASLGRSIAKTREKELT